MADPKTKQSQQEDQPKSVSDKPKPEPIELAPAEESGDSLKKHGDKLGEALD